MTGYVGDQEDAAYRAGQTDAIDALARWVEQQACCGAPALCGATCQDGEQSAAIASTARMWAAMIRTDGAHAVSHRLVPRG